MAGVYQPRSRGAAMSDALAEARIALARLTQLVIMRGAGALVLLATIAVGWFRIRLPTPTPNARALPGAGRS